MPTWDWTASTLKNGLQRSIKSALGVEVGMRREVLDVAIGTITCDIGALGLWNRGQEMTIIDDIDAGWWPLAGFAVGDTDKARASGFVCCPWMYWWAAAQLLEDETKYKHEKRDFNAISKTDFFRLGDRVKTKPGRLGKRKVYHRWGIIGLMVKLKTFKKVRSGEITRWCKLKWRIIVPYSQSVWKNWHQAVGRALRVLARKVYPKGSVVFSTDEIQQVIRRHNQRFGRRRGQG